MKVFLFFTLVIAARCWYNPYEYAGMVYYDEKDNQQVIPLTSVDTFVDIKGLSVGITAELKYLNPTGVDIQCHFVFPLSSKSAVYRLEALIDGRKLIAKVEEREAAKRKYDEAAEAGKKAILLRNEPGVGDVFRLSLGNLPAHSTAVVRLGYVQPVDRIYSDGIISVTLPIALNPRYVPYSDLVNRNPDDLNMTDDTFISVSNSYFDFIFQASVDLGLDIPIKSIRTGNSEDVLQIKWSETNTRADVKLISEFAKNQDFQLLIEPARPFEPMIIIEPRVHSDSNVWLSNDIAGAWLVSEDSLPQINPSNLEIWVVLDRSGSMEGDKIANAREALLTLLSELPAGCLFNIISFGSSFVPLFEEGPRKITLSLRNDVSIAVKDFDASLGGTEILEALYFIYNRPKVVQDPHKRYILLLSDGEVTNTDSVINLCARNSKSTKVFSIGIGQGASTALVNGVARVSDGASAFVRSSDDRLQLKVLEMFDSIIRPGLDDPKFKWSISNGGDVKQMIPEQIYSKTGGNGLFQYAVISHFKGQTVSGSVLFSASNLKHCYGCTVEFELEQSVYSNLEDAMPLHYLSAKILLTTLEDRYRRDNNGSVRQLAIDISKATGVLCDFTALLAVDSETSEATYQRARPTWEGEVLRERMLWDRPDSSFYLWSRLEPQDTSRTGQQPEGNQRASPSPRNSLTSRPASSLQHSNSSTTSAEIEQLFAELIGNSSASGPFSNLQISEAISIRAGMWYPLVTLLAFPAFFFM